MSARAPEPGSLGTEAARLVEAVQGWARDTIGEHNAAECQFCPLCRLLNVLTTERPDLAVRVGEVTDAVVAAVRSVLDSGSDRPNGQHGHDTGARGTEERPPAGPGVERIDVTD